MHIQPCAFKRADDARAFRIVDHAIARGRRDHRAQHQHGGCVVLIGISGLAKRAGVRRRLDLCRRFGGLARLMILPRLVGKPAHHRESAKRRRAADKTPAPARAQQQQAQPAERRARRHLVLSCKGLRLREQVAARLARRALQRLIRLRANPGLLRDRSRALFHACDAVIQQPAEHSANVAQRILAPSAPEHLVEQFVGVEHGNLPRGFSLQVGASASQLQLQD